VRTAGKSPTPVAQNAGKALPAPLAHKAYSQRLTLLEKQD
jgi:hypothetical protein